MRTTQSQKYFSEAKAILVGGVNSPVRSFKAVQCDPLIMRSGERARIFDCDHNGYTDYCLSWGALILGHAHRNVVLAAKKTVEKGISFGTTTREEIEIARHIQECIPSIELIRFVNSGTEATMSAIRLSRGFTGRDLVVKFDGCYHGHVDDLLARAGSGVAELPSSSSLGIPRSHLQNTISLPYNDTAMLVKILDQHKEKIACVIIEPVAGNMGVVPAKKEFLKTLRELTQKFGIVLIFDEIITGFRFLPGGVQTELGIVPDITCLGKIIGGGFPVGAYGGRQDIMRTLAPSGRVYQAGTFSGNPVVMKAGLATLRLLNKDFYRTLNSRCESFAQGLNKFLKENDVDAYLSYYGSMMSLRFRQEEVLNYEDAQKASEGQIYAKLFQHLLKNGIYFPPADLETFFVSGMHSKKDMGTLLEAIKSFFKSSE